MPILIAGFIKLVLRQISDRLSDSRAGALLPDVRCCEPPSRFWPISSYGRNCKPIVARGGSGWGGGRPLGPDEILRRYRVDRPSLSRPQPLDQAVRKPLSARRSAHSSGHSYQQSITVVSRPNECRFCPPSSPSASRPPFKRPDPHSDFQYVNARYTPNRRRG
jgi:hypothetical protein